MKFLVTINFKLILPPPPPKWKEKKPLSLPQLVSWQCYSLFDSWSFWRVEDPENWCASCAPTHTRSCCGQRLACSRSCPSAPATNQPSSKQVSILRILSLSKLFYFTCYVRHNDQCIFKICHCSFCRWNASSGYASWTPESKACTELPVDTEKSVRCGDQDRQCKYLPITHTIHCLNLVRRREKIPQQFFICWFQSQFHILGRHGGPAPDVGASSTVQRHQCGDLRGWHPQQPDL